MKDTVKKILGKTVNGVIIKIHKHHGKPCSQLFITFEDNTYFEFYCSNDIIRPTGGPGAGTSEDVKKYMAEPMKIELEIRPQADS